MAIQVTCTCGKSLSVKDELAGRKVKCPACQKPLRVPAAEEFAEDEIDVEPAELLQKSREGGKSGSRGKSAKKGKKSSGSNRGLMMGLVGGGGILMAGLIAWLLWPEKKEVVADTPVPSALGTPATGTSSVTTAPVTPIPAVSPTSHTAPTSTETLSGDLKALQGTWQVAVLELPPGSTGADAVVAASKQDTYAIKDDTLTITRSCGVSLYQIKIDPLQTPSGIDMTLLETNEPNSPQTKSPQLGIYSIEGETWKWCLSHPGTARPLVMKADKALEHRVVSFRRSSTHPDAPIVAFNMMAWLAAESQLKAMNVHAGLAPVLGESGFAEGITHVAGISPPETADGTLSPELWAITSSLSHVMLRTVCTTDATLEQVSRHPGLVGLNLSGRFSVTPAGIASLKPCSHLSGLYFSEVPISAELLTAVSQLSQLRSFGIYKSPVSSEMLGSIVQLNQLESLSLQETGTTDADVVQIVKLTKLKTLFLSNTKVTDTGLNTLKSLKDLTMFSVQGLTVTPQAVADFEAALPKCQVQK